MKKIARTKIVATIGPSTWNDDVLKKMFDSGMRIARINASFADFAELTRVSNQIRKISPRIAIVLDTQGTKIRVKGLSKDIEVKDTLVLSSSENPNPNIIKITYPSLSEDVVVGTKIFLDDGNIQLEVKEIQGENVVCDVTQGGVLKPNKTVNIPDVNLKFPLLTEKDIQDIKYAKELKFDYVCASFVRNKKDVLEVKELLKDSKIKIIAKIENRQGVENFDEILNEADAIMVARGDMGVELPLEEVPILQKQMIYKSRAVGKPVIVATQMLESMRDNRRPTRAEVSDVANAVMDGTDCLMLSAETSTGKYPVDSVAYMNRIALRTEQVMRLSPISGQTEAGKEVDELALTACKFSTEVNYNAVLIVSDANGVVGSVSRHRPNIPIYVVSSSFENIRENILFNGVETYYIKELSDDRDNNIRLGVEKIYASGELELLDKIAIISGSSIKNKKSDSILEIITVKDVLDS